MDRPQADTAAGPEEPALTRRRVATVAAAWAAVAILFGTQQAATSASFGWRDVLQVIVFNTLWAIVTLGLLVFVRRARSWRLSLRIAGYAGLGFAVAPLVLALSLAIGSLADPNGPVIRLGAIVTNILTSLVVYWMALGAVLIVEQRRAAREEQARRAGAERRLAETRAAMLRTQLQPHFLFNALNTIAGLIPEDPRAAEAMTVRLGALLRLTLEERSGPLVPLAAELEAVDAYLAIEKIRFGDRLTVVLDIDPAAMTVRVPDLILQPLVENALRHGLAPIPQGGRVDIVGRIDRAMLVLTIADTGVGCAVNEVTEGIGLRNSRERLELLRPPGSLTIESNGEGGFSVVLAVPLAS